MDYREWYLALSDEQRAAYAERAGTTAGYIRVHLIGRRKIPRPALLARLASASEGSWTEPSLLAFFYRTGSAVGAEGDSSAVVGEGVGS